MSYFNSIAPKYDAVRGREILPSVLRSVSSAARPGETVVDVATGTGLFSIPLSQKGYRVLGIDANAQMLSEAKNKTGELKTSFRAVQAVAEQLPLKTDSVRVILSTNAIHHFKIRQHLKEVQRVLMPGGRYIIFTRFAEQNARSIWGQLFPDFAEKENRLFSAEDFHGLDREFAKLALEEVEELTFVKPFFKEQLVQTAKQRKYSTFAMYSETEFRRAVNIFEQRLEAWSEKHYVAEIGRLVFRVR